MYILISSLTSIPYVDIACYIEVILHITITNLISKLNSPAYSERSWRYGLLVRHK